MTLLSVLTSDAGYVTHGDPVNIADFVQDMWYGIYVTNQIELKEMK